ncbi:MAG: septation protein A [Pseudomonadota bacterium]
MSSDKQRGVKPDLAPEAEALSEPDHLETGDDDGGSDSDQPLLKLAVEAGPLVVFFISNSFAEELYGATGDAKIFWATGAFMVATVIALAVSRIVFSRVPVMPLVSGVFVLFFGALTLWLQDDLFIKIKPTIVNLLFAGILGVGYLTGRLLLKYVMGDAIRLTETGWRILTVRWTLFFVFLAILNEVIWRNFSTDFWAAFKLFGIMPITLTFAIAQVGVLTKHQAE